MKLFLNILVVTATFFGCSHNNAFERFGMSDERERSEESIQSSKVINKDTVHGVATAVHLNKTYPELYKDAEYFYIYFNIDEESQGVFFELNGLPSLLVEELNSTNEFTYITYFDAEWKHYYLVGFAKTKGALELTLKYNETNTTFIFKNE